ncbi:MAG: hypothetical protein Q4G04_00250 [bacterium]|nr:hypothetical protein [bacterium]
MSKKSNKKKNKKTIKIVAICVVIVLLVAFICIYFAMSKNDATRFRNEYTQVSKDNVFVYAEVDEIIDILSTGTGVVYLSFPECPWCQAYASILNEAAKSAGLEKIYYYNIKQDRADNTENYQKITGILQQHLPTDSNNNPRVYVPNVTVVKNGLIIFNDNETSTISSNDITPTEYWSKEKKEPLENALITAFKQINSCNTCN